MKVPLLDLKAQNEALAGELKEAFARVLASGQFILGKEVEQFEQQCAALVGAKHGIGVSSGTDAILLALMALGIGPGDEVICPSFTFFATAGCIARAGAKPVFADSEARYFNIDPDGIERLITPRTKAIMPVHLFGQAAEMDRVMEIARTRGVPVIEDAAQALSARYQGRGAGSIGEFGTYSFFPSKNLGGFGDAGLLVTSDDGLAAKARLLRTHGAKPKYFHKVVGGNFRIDPIQAALLAVKLPNLASYSAARQSNAAYYIEKLGSITGVEKACSGVKPGGALKIVLPAALDGNEHIWNQFTLRVVAGAGWKQPESPRNALQKFLASREIGSEIYYPQPMHLQDCFAVSGKVPDPLPVSERLAIECLSIPIYPELKREQQDAVVSAMAEFVSANSQG